MDFKKEKSNQREREYQSESAGAGVRAWRGRHGSFGRNMARERERKSAKSSKNSALDLQSRDYFFFFL